MKSINTFFHRQSLRSRLILWFLLISLIPLSWAIYTSYSFAKSIIITQATQQLKALSLRQSRLIESYFREKERAVASLAKGVTEAAAVEQFKEALNQAGKESEEYQHLNQRRGAVLAFRSEVLGFSNLFLISNDGEIVYSAKPSQILGVNLFAEGYQDSQLLRIFEEAKNHVQTQISSLTYFHPQETPAAFISAPLLDEDLIVRGVVIAQIDSSAIYSLLGEYSGLGQTGESFLVTQIGNELISLSPLRHAKPHQEIHIIPAATPFGQFVTQVLNGERPVATIPDYRGEETLMAGRYLMPILHWGIITKMDTTELLAPIDRLKWFSIFIALATAGMVILFAIYVANTIAQPINLLTAKTRLMAAGNLSQRINAPWNDEIGGLAQSFNNMASQLHGLVKNLDTIVAKRTEELESQKEQLENTVDELQQTQNRLINQEKLASLGALTAGIAHEIKNPLNFINNFAELSIQIDNEMEQKIDNIKSKISEDDANTLHDYLETLKLNVNKIYEHGKRADSIVRNMLQHSRGTPGESVLTDVNALLDEYIALSYHGMRAQNSSFNIKIEKDYDKNLPPIYLVPQEISRVFLNVLNNAYYSAHKKKLELGDDYSPILKVTTRQQGRIVVIKIWDNGKGIAPDVFPKLFTPFFTTKPAGEGTGLGLSLSYNIIVQGHQGTLTANSEEGVYAEFIITLPLKT